jgi:hypothetical protein
MAHTPYFSFELAWSFAEFVYCGCYKKRFYIFLEGTSNAVFTEITEGVK